MSDKLKFRLDESAAFFLVDGTPLLFCERSQTLFELNETSAFLACHLEDDATVDALLAHLTPSGSDDAQARDVVIQCLTGWARQGLLCASIADADETVSHRERLDVGGTTVEIAYHGDDLVRTVAPLFSLFAAPSDDGAPLHSYDLVPFGTQTLVIGPLGRCQIVSAHEAAPALKAAVVQALLDNVETDVALHAALLVGDNGGVLVCGPPGAGKSTLTMALVEAGFGYGGDDIVLVDEDGRCRPIPFALTLKDGSWGLLAGSQDAITASAVHERLDTARVRYIVPGSKNDGGRCSIRTIVVLRRDTDGPASLVRMSLQDVLAEFVSGGFTSTRKLTSSQLASLITVATNANAFYLHYSSVYDGAAYILKNHDADPIPEPS